MSTTNKDPMKNSLMMAILCPGYAMEVIKSVPLQDIDIKNTSGRALTYVLQFYRDEFQLSDSVEPITEQQIYDLMPTDELKEHAKTIHRFCMGDEGRIEVVNLLAIRTFNQLA